jgi:hypothetical protein
MSPTDAEIAELQDRLELGTRLPWSNSGVRAKMNIDGVVVDCLRIVDADGVPFAFLPIGATHEEQAEAIGDAKLIAAAVNALPRLLAALREAREDAARYRLVKLNVRWEDERDMAPGGRYWWSMPVDRKYRGVDEAIDAARSAGAPTDAA